MSTIKRLTANCSVLLGAVLIYSSSAAPAQESDYKIEFAHQGPVGVSDRDALGRPGIFITLRFSIRRGSDNQLVTDLHASEIVIEEDHVRIADREIVPPAATPPITVVLALDVSGSMAKQGKITEAKRAALVFLDKVQRQSDCGLILFDHLIRAREVPAAGRQQHKIRAQIESAQAQGGTAYLDAAAAGVTMLAKVPGQKALVLMTDGVDMHSRQSLAQAISAAISKRVPVYVLGVGAPGKKEPTSTVLVLDQSGSMSQPAGEGSRLSKIEALRLAARKFIDGLRTNAAVTLVPFQSKATSPGPFTSDKTELIDIIDQLRTEGETALYDAGHVAVETLIAARRPGKQAVVLLTDGKDTLSRHRPEEIVATAREFGIAIHTLGFGRDEDLNGAFLQQMAKDTGGQYYHARNEDDLIRIFEDLSFRIQDDGIDENALRRLADETGGKYYPARDVAQLPIIYEEIAEELQGLYTVTFASRRPHPDGTARGIAIHVERQGRRASSTVQTAYTVHGVIVPVMNPIVYLGLLALLLGLLMLPAALQHRRSSTVSPS